MLHKIYMQHKKKVICYELEAQTQACYTKTLFAPPSRSRLIPLKIAVFMKLKYQSDCVCNTHTFSALVKTTDK